MVKSTPVKHSLVPKHTKMGERAVKELLEKYNISKVQLPKILSSDPALKGVGSKVGDVIKIERKSFTAGTSLYYRVVADAAKAAGEAGEEAGEVEYESEE
ncbi:DNA-directed RNA polymerase subunit H [Candidatus Woesearchaeota archaeon]|nr:DNA-directed RNA polymerase subunit H [Candidatus Woesearchaeota archaeon]MBW3017910.1 DNA-directed RNA polymerase subunit H [Candidatus Woesearchaeota archaeon]